MQLFFRRKLTLRAIAAFFRSLAVFDQLSCSTGAFFWSGEFEVELEGVQLLGIGLLDEVAFVLVLLLLLILLD